MRYSDYLSKPDPKAFVIASDGEATSVHGGFDPLGNALRMCQKNGRRCYAYAIDNDVVWVPPEPDRPIDSHYATIEDIKSVPYVNDDGRAFYARFLKHDPPRAIVITQSGVAYTSFGGLDPLADALALCHRAFKDCQPYAVNSTVVWVHPEPVPPASHYAQLNDFVALPSSSSTLRIGYQQFLASPKPRAFVLAKDGSWEYRSRGPSPVTLALAACNAKHAHCALYAVDDDVVWPVQKNDR